MKRLKIQNIFNCISIVFILTCCIIYGTRFIKYYSISAKKHTESENSVAEKIYSNNKDKDYYKKINDDYYFIGETDTNYLKYSNILWRIIKVNNNNEILLISDSSLTSLAYGQNKTFIESNISTWLSATEKEYTGILQSALNDTSSFLTSTKTCLDEIDTIDNKDCVNEEDTEISLLSTRDYAIIGKTSYLNNNENFYLANITSDNKVWYISSEGKILTNLGTDVIGIRPTITLKANLDYQAGSGTKDDPYIIETEQYYFGSYVKLGNDMWRIYQDNNETVKLVLTDYVKVNNDYITYKYSNSNSVYNTKTSGSLAYYLNNTYLNTLSYKDKLIETTWSNGYYGSSNDFDYTKALSSTVKAKVSLLSIGDIILNNDLNEFYTTTSSIEKGTMVYSLRADKKMVTRYVTTTEKVVPTICIEKNILSKGNGTLESPYEVE